MLVSFADKTILNEVLSITAQEWASGDFLFSG